MVNREIGDCSFNEVGGVLDLIYRRPIRPVIMLKPERYKSTKTELKVEFNILTTLEKPANVVGRKVIDWREIK